MQIELLHPSDPPRQAATSIIPASAATESACDSHLYRQALAQSADSVVITDSEGLILYVNRAFETMSGFGANEAIGRPASILKSGEHVPEFYASIWSALNLGQSFRGVIINRAKDGTLFREEQTISAITSAEGEITHFIATGRNVDARFAAEQQIFRLAYYDSLTGLAKRELLMKWLDESLKKSHEQCHGIVLMLDINNLKRINDTLGYEAGDSALRMVGNRLESFCVDCSLSSVVGARAARTGGDEFTIVIELPNPLQPQQAIADRVLEILGQPHILGGQEVFLSASVGIAKFPEDAQTAEELLRNADLALHRAKEAGRNLYLYYHDTMRDRLYEDLQIESELHGALERNEFSLVFQPIVRTADGEVMCVEALLRWQSPSLGSVPPARFIPQLEKNGLIVAVGRWVIEAACRAVQRLRNREGSPLRVAVNISARQLVHPNFVHDVKSALEISHLPSDRLELEITETVLIENAAVAAKVLHELRHIGVRMGADDFGTGYSSLSYLWKFPFHSLKIDRSFVAEMRHDPQVRVIVSSIVNLAQALGLDVVAEGVENAMQRDMLHEAGCPLIQGFWNSRPLAAHSLNAIAMASYCTQPEEADAGGCEAGAQQMDRMRHALTGPTA